jgi:hypothetical protein
MLKYKNPLARLTILASLSITILAGSFYLKGENVMAQNSIDRRFIPLIPELSREVRIPVRLPSSLGPFSSPDVRLRVGIDGASADEYTISISKQRCSGGMANCKLGLITGHELTPDYRVTDDYGGERVRLARGIRGLFQEPYGKLVLSELSWEQSNVVYSIGVKGSKAKAIQIANSMILSQPINR